MTRPPHPQEHCGHECVCDFYISLGMKKEPCPMNGHPKNPCEHDTRSHSSPAAAPVPDELETRFTTKQEAWEQGFEDGKTAALVDLNIIENQAAAKERERAERMYALMMEVHQENTDEFMEYYEQRMHEFEESLRGEQPGEYANAQGCRK